MQSSERDQTVAPPEWVEGWPGKKGHKEDQEKQVWIQEADASAADFEKFKEDKEAYEPGKTFIDSEYDDGPSSDTERAHH